MKSDRTSRSPQPRCGIINSTDRNVSEYPPMQVARARHLLVKTSLSCVDSAMDNWQNGLAWSARFCVTSLGYRVGCLCVGLLIVELAACGAPVSQTQSTPARKKPATGNQSRCTSTPLNLDTALAQRPNKRCSSRVARAIPKGIAARLVLTPARVTGGAAVKVRAVWRNNSRVPIVLKFICHSGPMFTVIATDGAGRRVGEPKGKRPRSNFHPGPPYAVCITLAPCGETYLERDWHAVQWGWATKPKPRPPGALPERKKVGPLPAGRYKLQMRTMLQAPAAQSSLAEPSAWLEVVSPNH